MSNPMAAVEAIFRRLLATGLPVALEDATRHVRTPEGYDRRVFGSIPRAMAKAGEIIETGFRISKTAKHNCGIKRLWVLVEYADVAEGGPRNG